jgi:hypothetical protein
MTYVALIYDHRIVDGREPVQFLKTIKEVLEEPAFVSRSLMDQPRGCNFRQSCEQQTPTARRFYRAICSAIATKMVERPKPLPSAFWGWNETLRVRESFKTFNGTD